MAAHTFNAKTWMTDVSSKIQNVQINLLPLPGSHDAVSYGGINEQSKAQGHNISTQLQHGIRYFDLRVRVKNGIFFGHHGADEVPNNQYCPSDPRPPNHSQTIFEQIIHFSDIHPGEIIILHFYDATGKGTDDFNREDRKLFIQEVFDAFGSRLAPPPNSANFGNRQSYSAIPTYKTLIDNKTPIIAMIRDTGDDSFYFIDGDSKNPVAFDKAYNDARNIWLASEWFGEKCSDYHELTRSWQTLHDLTAEDQENELTEENGKANRDLNKFWVSQTILHYLAVLGSHSRNYYGAEAMNKWWDDTYSNWYHGKRWNGEPVEQGKKIRTPNVLLLDYSSVFGHFPKTCFNLLNQ